MKKEQNHTSFLVKTGRILKLDINYAKPFVECRCICGRIRFYNQRSIDYFNRISCGCKKKGLNSAVATHLGTGTRLFSIFNNMRQRCYNKNSYGYKWYGERGITVCDEWNYNFYNFKLWALNNGYSEDLTLDRINANDNYEPENCKWSTAKEQSNNRRNNRIIEVDGVKKTLTQWSNVLKKHPSSLSSTIDRTSRYGLTPQDVIKNLQSNPSFRFYNKNIS